MAALASLTGPRATRVLGLGHYRPGNIITNHDLIARGVDTDDDGGWSLRVPEAGSVDAHACLRTVPRAQRYAHTGAALSNMSSRRRHAMWRQRDAAG